MSLYHIKYFNERTYRTDNLTMPYEGSPSDAVRAFLHEHPEAECVYQVFEQVPIRRNVHGSRWKVDVGNTARVVEAHDAKEAAEVVSAQVHRLPRRVWRLCMFRDHKYLVEAS